MPPLRLLSSPDKQVIKPLTKFFQCSYAELLRANGDSGPKGAGPAVARATVALSHAWQRPFLDLLAAAEERLSGAAENGPHYLWIDVFCLNQHSADCAAAGCDCRSRRPLQPLSQLSEFPFREVSAQLSLLLRAAA